MFWGRQPSHDVNVLRRFRDWLRLHLQGVAGGLVELKLISFGSTKPPATPWKWERSQSLYSWKTFKFWHSWLPENISLESVATKASRHILWTWWWTLRFHKMQGSFWLVELLASQEWLCYMDSYSSSLNPEVCIVNTHVQEHRLYL